MHGIRLVPAFAAKLLGDDVLCLPLPGVNGFFVTPVRQGNFVRALRDRVELDATKFSQGKSSHPLSDLGVFIVQLICLGSKNYDKHGIGAL